MQLPAGAPVAATRHVEDSKRGLLRVLRYRRCRAMGLRTFRAQGL